RQRCGIYVILLQPNSVYQKVASELNDVSGDDSTDRLLHIHASLLRQAEARSTSRVTAPMESGKTPQADHEIECALRAAEIKRSVFSSVRTNITMRTERAHSREH